MVYFTKLCSNHIHPYPVIPVCLVFHEWLLVKSNNYCAPSHIADYLYQGWGSKPVVANILPHEWNLETTRLQLAPLHPPLSHGKVQVLFTPPTIWFGVYMIHILLRSFSWSENIKNSFGLIESARVSSVPSHAISTPGNHHGGTCTVASQNYGEPRTDSFSKLLSCKYKQKNHRKISI